MACNHHHHRHHYRYHAHKTDTFQGNCLVGNHHHHDYSFHAHLTNKLDRGVPPPPPELETLKAKTLNLGGPTE